MIATAATSTGQPSKTGKSSCRQGKPHVDIVAVGTAEVVADAARDELFEKDPSSFVNRQKRINRIRYGSEQVEWTADSAFFTAAPDVKGTSSEVPDLIERAEPADQTERVDQTEQAVSSGSAEAVASTSEAGSTAASNSPAPSSPTQHAGSPTVSERIPFLAGLIEAGEPLNDYLRYSADQRKSMLGAMQMHMAETFRNDRGLEVENLQSTALLMFHPDVPNDDRKQATLLVAKHMNLFLEVGNARDVEDWKIVSPRNELSKEELSFALAAQGIGLGGGDGVIPIYVFDDSFRERPSGKSLAQRLRDFNQQKPEAIVLAFGNQYMPAVVQRDPDSGKVKLTVVNTESQRAAPPIHEQRAQGLRQLLSGDDTLEVQIVQVDAESPDASGALSLMLLSGYCDPQQQGAEFATFAARYMKEFRTATQEDRTDWIAAARARSFISSNEELKRTPEANVKEGT